MSRLRRQPSQIKTADADLQGLVFALESGADVLLTEEKFTRKRAAPSMAPAAPVAEKTNTPADLGVHKPSPLPAALAESRARALAAQSLDDLHNAIAGFDGFDIKRTATNMVFADGVRGARVMLIGEAPGEEEDLQGKPFVGKSGQLLDKILLSIGLSRADNLYISNVLNWRPPGNRTPTPQEMEIARPFIEQHIALAAPDLVLMAGAVALQTLLPDTPTLAKARERFHDYTPRTAGITLSKPVAAYALYHPAYLLRSPGQKKKAWHDMLKVKAWLEARQD